MYFALVTECKYRDNLLLSKGFCEYITQGELYMADEMLRQTQIWLNKTYSTKYLRMGKLEIKHTTD